MLRLAPLEGDVRRLFGRLLYRASYSQNQWHHAVEVAFVCGMIAAELGLDVADKAQQTPEGLAAFQKAEIEKWWPIIKAANIRGD